jgi:hypothetical protein
MIVDGVQYGRDFLVSRLLLGKPLSVCAPSLGALILLVTFGPAYVGRCQASSLGLERMEPGVASWYNILCYAVVSFQL